MKKIVAMILTIVLLAVSLSGCSIEGKKFIDNYLKVNEFKVVDQTTEIDVELNLKNLIEFAQTFDSSSNELTLGGFERLLEDNPVIKVKMSIDAYASRNDLRQIQSESKMSISLSAFGATVKASDIHFFVNNDNVFIDKDYFVFISDFMAALKEKFGYINDDNTNVLKKELLAIDEAYIRIPLGEMSKNSANYNTMYSLSHNIEYNQKILEQVRKLQKTLYQRDFDIPVARTGDTYSVKLNSSQIVDVFVKAVDAFGDDFVAMYKDLSPANSSELKNSLSEFKTYLESSDGAAILGVIKEYTKGSEVSISNKLKDNSFKEDFTFNLNLLSKPIMTASTTNSILDANSRKIEFPLLSNSITIDKIENIFLMTQLSGTKPEPEPTVITSEAFYKRQSVLINGKQVEFDTYNIDGYTYFKLRDLAQAMNQTDKQFNVMWDGPNNTIYVLPNREYTFVDKKEDVEKIDMSNKEAQFSYISVMLAEQPAFAMAYNIEGSNYFKLRDIGQLLDFYVVWDEETKTIKIDAKRAYEMVQ